MSADDLKARLRNPGWHDCNHHLVMDEAADRIATLEAEVERLREALRPFALAADAVEKHDPTFPEHGACLRASFDWFVRVPDSDGVPDFVRKSATRADLCRARAALKNTDHTNQENSDAG